MQARLSLHCELIYEVHVWPLNRKEQSFIQTAVDILLAKIQFTSFGEYVMHGPRKFFQRGSTFFTVS